MPLLDAMAGAIAGYHCWMRSAMVRCHCWVPCGKVPLLGAIAGVLLLGAIGWMPLLGAFAGR